MQLIRRILNRETMQQILDCFVELTGIRTAYFDNYKELVNGRDKDICKFCRLIRTYPDILDSCSKSDINAIETTKSLKKLYFYQCHIGLWETVIPIYVREVSAGYLMIGQIKCTDEEEKQIEELNARLSTAGAPFEEIEAIKVEYSNMVSLSREKLEAVVKMLDIISNYVISTEVVALQDLETVEKIRRIVCEHFNENISTKYIAKKVYMSESYLSYLFKKETGDTITGYIDKTRLKKAKDLLNETSMSIKEISFEVGYQDQNYFSRIFRKYESLSPTDYRCKARYSKEKID